jgi:hypothetical protein
VIAIARMGAVCTLLNMVVTMMKRALVLLLLAMAAAPGAAQSLDTPGDPNSIWAVVKSVVLDPTTYAPAVISGTAAKLDWNSSQVFFEHGFSERNPRFTISGRSGGEPISFEAGNQRIVADTLTVLQTSVIHNFGSQIVERVLVAKHPKHRKIIKTIGWIERMTVAAYWSYSLSAGHWQQWRTNSGLARELGFK